VLVNGRVVVEDGALHALLGGGGHDA